MTKQFKEALIKLAKEHKLEVTFECQYCGEKINWRDGAHLDYFVTFTGPDEEGPQT